LVVRLVQGFDQRPSPRGSGWETLFCQVPAGGQLLVMLRLCAGRGGLAALEVESVQPADAAVLGQCRGDRVPHVAAARVLGQVAAEQDLGDGVEFQAVLDPEGPDRVVHVALDVDWTRFAGDA
jgi:hypothetical protein